MKKKRLPRRTSREGRPAGHVSSSRTGGEELQRLLETIAIGSIEDLDELDPQDLQLLRQHCGGTDDFQEILDRLRCDESP